MTGSIAAVGIATGMIGAHGNATAKGLIAMNGAATTAAVGAEVVDEDAGAGAIESYPYLRQDCRLSFNSRRGGLRPDPGGDILKNILVKVLILGGWSAVSCPTALAQSSLQLGTGVQYSSGDFGREDDTTILEVPFTARLKAGNWSFRARLPFASIEGPGGIIPGEDDDGRQRRRRRGRDDDDDSDAADEIDDDDLGLDDEDPEFSDFNESGLGDISLSASYSFDLSAHNYLDLTGKVTLPTGDEDKDLGLGETDYLLSGEIGQDFTGGGLYVLGGYRMRGGSAREDGAIAAVGGYAITGSTITGVEVNWSEPSLASSQDALGITGYTSFRLSDDIRLSLFAEAGLSDNTADYGGGLGLTWRTNFRRPFQKR